MKHVFLALLIVLILSGIALAHTVTVNLVMNIGNNANNTIHVNSTDYSTSGVTVGSSSWFNSSWNRRVNITINESQIIASHLNFPVLINITDTNLATYAQADGDDILFANDTVQFAHEIEYFNATDGRLVAWVNIPNLTGGFEFSMYYNNSAASSSQNKVGTWVSDYGGVWHFSNGTNLDIQDSTKYGNNGTVTGSVATSGLFDGGALFDGTDDMINLTGVSSVDTSNKITFEFWVRHDTIAGENRLMLAKGTNSVSAFKISVTSEGNLTFLAKWTGGGIVGTGTVIWTGPLLSTATNYHISISYDSSSTTNDPTMVVNGVNISYVTQIGADGTGQTIDRTMLYYITGVQTDNSWDLWGEQDEIRIANTSRTLEWIATEYANQINTTKFTIFGGEETAPTSSSALSTSLTFVNLNNRYISANSTTSIAAIASAGTLLNIRFNNTYNSTHYLLQMTQDSDKNRFLIAMTNGTYNDIDDRLAMIDNLKTVSSTFGKFLNVAPSSFTTFIRLEYTNVDIDRIVEWSGIGRLLIKNRGLTGRGVPNITLEVVR